MRNRGTENRKVNGKCKSNYISNNIKCEWMKQSIGKTEIIRLEFKKLNKILTMCSLEKKNMLNSKIQQMEGRRMKIQPASNNHKSWGSYTTTRQMDFK